MDGSRQEEKVTVEKFDRMNDEAYSLRDNGIRLTLYATVDEWLWDASKSTVDLRTQNVGPEIGSFLITQIDPCQKNDTDCSKVLYDYNSRASLIKF